MADERLLTIRDAAIILGVSEKEVMDLAESGAVPAYKIAGVYLRFKRHEIESYKKKAAPFIHKEKEAEAYTLQDKISDFFYFNDFYILSGLLVIFMLLIIFRG